MVVMPYRMSWQVLSAKGYYMHAKKMQKTSSVLLWGYSCSLILFVAVMYKVALMEVKEKEEIGMYRKHCIVKQRHITE